MTRIILLLIFSIIGVVAHAQDCYEPLLNKGIAEYNSGNYETAKKKWQSALDYCPDLTDSQKQTLNDWLSKKPPISTPSVNTAADMPEMVFVQGGSFKMGSNDYSGEKPIHAVALDNFYIGKYEVTVAQFAAFVKETAYVTTAEREDSSRIYDGSSWKWQRGVFWKHGISGSVRPQSEYNHPVIHVSWHDAAAYCDWLNRKTGHKYRLPTEAEWEYAARGGQQTHKYKYSGSNTIEDVAWYWDNANKLTHTVGTKQANELGLYDMTGNVLEWCNDWYDSDYYQNSPSRNPQGAASGTYRVLRGGAWDGVNLSSRVAVRVVSIPTGRNYNVGFRVARY